MSISAFKPKFCQKLVAPKYKHQTIYQIISYLFIIINLNFSPSAQSQPQNIDKRPTQPSNQLALNTQATLNAQTSDLYAPETTTHLTSQQQTYGKKWMIATANPYASKAGADILAQGGNAIDAMVATQSVLGLVEPQSSGLGGGAFLVYWDEEKQKLTSFDGRETAPKAATGELFLDKQGKPLQFYDAVVGGRSVGTPGTVKLLYETHQKLGKLSWQKVLAPAIKLAQEGFTVSPRLAQAVKNDAKYLKKQTATKHYFFPNDKPIQAGQNLKNPAYAQTLIRLAKDGADGFYQGEIAKNIVKTVQNHPTNPGVLALSDFENYQIKQRAAICAPYHEYQICGMGPPSSGALTLGQIFGILSHFPLANMGADNPQSWRLIGDASRLAFADRAFYMADEDFVSMPTQGLIDPNYLTLRAQLLLPFTHTPDASQSSMPDNRASMSDHRTPANKLMPSNKTKALKEVKAGTPPSNLAYHYAKDAAIELPSTSHFSIVDKNQNVLSMTTTIENGFGSRLMVNGFLLNNELTDFSFKPFDKIKTDDGKSEKILVANRIEAQKRPRSSMAPTIVFKDNKPLITIGSPGGSQIIGYVAKTLIAHLDWNLDLQQAIALPNMNNRFGTFEIEDSPQAKLKAAQLQKLGYQTQIKDLNSGVQAIKITNNQLVGAADPRREGMVISDTNYAQNKDE